MQAHKAVIPAAGLGTRVLPATKAVPKEMLPLADRPTIQYIVDEAVTSGISDITIVTSRSKRAIEDHFDQQPELRAALERKGDTEKLAMLQRIETMANICFVRQQEPKGLGHAVLMAKSTIGDEPFGVMLGDDVFVNPGDPVLGQLIRVQARLGGSVLAVMRVPRERIPSYGMVALDPAGDVDARTHRVHELVEKPPIAESPSDLAIMGRYVLSPSIFAALEVTPPGAGGEIQLTDAIRLLGRREPVYAYEFEGTRYDTGDPVGLLTTSLAFSLARPDLAPGIKAFLKTLHLD
jgi:UTP--glucose-1-phosphate uridylyltransferase